MLFYTVVHPNLSPLTEKWKFFGTGRFALLVKSLKTVRYVRGKKNLTKNGNELCTVRFELFNEKTDHGTLFVTVKNRNGNGRF